ncbi:L-selectin-like [Pelobates fuscus]|uniref:L-selectin-like n=1 Tax=Pelobates fuscus TaxID=191477 RepID=UPI002FE45F33
MYCTHCRASTCSYRHIVRAKQDWRNTVMMDKIMYWRILKAFQLVLLCDAALNFPTATCWTYHYSSKNMNYTEARNYCQKEYTDLVAIQNKKEIEYLETHIPRNPTYYWIGIRKINGHWTWVGTNKTLTPEATNWASGEPNNQKSTEDCVEIYIKRVKDAGMWNDDDCRKKKSALCYTASCDTTLCGDHGECVETINNYTCSCDDGFYGYHCEHVVQCPRISDTPHALISCIHPWEKFSFTSSCKFECEQGYVLKGAEKIECLSTTNWTAPLPVCTAVKCENLTIPQHGYVDCVHPLAENSYNSTCEYKCFDGWKLQGSNITACGISGRWVGPTPTCEAAKCEFLQDPTHGSVACEHPYGEFSYETTCHFECSEGWILKGSNVTKCRSLGQWTDVIPKCEAVQCKPLEIAKYDFINCTHPFGNFTFGTVCEFTCNKSGILDVSNKTECQASGEWSEDIFLCEALGEITFSYAPTGHSKTAVIIGGSTAGSILACTIAVLLIRQKLKKARQINRDILSLRMVECYGYGTSRTSSGPQLDNQEPEYSSYHRMATSQAFQQSWFWKNPY